MLWQSGNKLLNFLTIVAVIFWGFLVWQEYNYNAERLVERGNYYFGGGAYDLDKAQEYFERALRLDPNVPDVWHQLARIDFLEGNFYIALSKINKQIEIHGESFMASFYVRGLIQGYMGNLSAAEQDFKKFLEWDQKNWAALNDLAWIYFQQGDYEKAEEVALLGLGVDPKNPWLLNSFGVSILNQGKKTEAREIFLKAREYAENLTAKDWQKAYPGNDPNLAGQGIENIKKIIESNLELTD